MTAKSTRQREILRDQKYPTDFKKAYYKEASEAVAKCIASNLEDVGVLSRAVALLSQMTTEKIGTQRRISLNIDAIEAFQEMLDSVDLMGFVPRLGPTSAPPLKVQNVEISVRPEIIVVGKGRRGALVGAIKLHFPRTHSIHEEYAGHISAALNEWCQANLASEGDAHGPACFVIDVGAGKQRAGTKATTNRMKEIEATCQNIAALWPTISPSG